MERIKYIDTLRGLAIILMVIGHVLAKCFKGTEVVLSSIIPDAPANVLVGGQLAMLYIHFIWAYSFF